MTDGVELRFWASFHSVETGEEKRLATFYLLNTSLNRNNWRVTDKALKDALPGLLGKPLGCIPGYRVNHVHEPIRVGRWVRVEKPDGYALATAEITDPVAWEKLGSGEWGPVSVVIRAFKVTCSECGWDITGSPDKHVASGGSHEVIESFVFDRVDFVAEPAYPQAGLLTLDHLAWADGGAAAMYQASAVPFEETAEAPEDRPWDGDAAEARVRRWAGGPDKDNMNWAKYRRAFTWYDREDQENLGAYKLPHHDMIDGRLSVVWNGVTAAMQVLLGARGGVNIPTGERRAVYNHLARHIRQYDREPPDYHASQSNMDGAQGPQGVDPKPEGKEKEKCMETQLQELRQELKTVKSENTRLMDELQRIEAERHQELVEAAVEARLKAGLARDRNNEVERLKGLDDQALLLLAEDAERVAGRTARAATTGPKAKYTADGRSALDSAVEDMRIELFGYRRES